MRHKSHALGQHEGRMRGQTVVGQPLLESCTKDMAATCCPQGLQVNGLDVRNDQVFQPFILARISVHVSSPPCLHPGRTPHLPVAGATEDLKCFQVEYLSNSNSLSFPLISSSKPPAAMPMSRFISRRWNTSLVVAVTEDDVHPRWPGTQTTGRAPPHIRPAGRRRCSHNTSGPELALDAGSASSRTAGHSGWTICAVGSVDPSSTMTQRTGRIV